MWPISIKKMVETALLICFSSISVTISFNREKSMFLSSRTSLNTARKCHPIPTFWVFLLILPLILQPQTAFGLPSEGQQLTVWPNTLSPSNKSPAFQPVIFVSPLPKVLPQTLSQFCILGFVTCSTPLSVWVQNFTSAVSYKGPNESFFKKIRFNFHLKPPIFLALCSQFQATRWAFPHPTLHVSSR